MDDKAPSGDADNRPTASSAERVSLTRFARVQPLTLALAESTTVDEVLDVVVDRGRIAAGATGVVALLHAESSADLEVARQVGVDVVESSPEARRLLVALAEDCLDREAARVSIDPGFGPPVVVAVPVSAGRRPLGALCLVFDSPGAVTPPEVELLVALGRHCGVALDRARLLAAERHARDELDRTHEQAVTARDRLAFLVRVGRSVLATLDHTEVLDRALDHAVPRIADAGMALLPGPEGLRRVAVAHGNPELAEWGRQRLLGTHVRYDAATPPSRAFATGEVVLQRDADATVLADVPVEFWEALESLALRCWLAVPIQAHGRVLGVLALAWTDPARLDDQEDVDLAIELAARAAAGLVNAELYEAQRDQALSLKETVLPRVLPQPAGLDVAARYLPSGADVGGDWYDAVVLGDGRVSFTVGDVSGHGLPAAATMGQLRNAVRAYAVDGHGPGALLDRLNRLLAVTTTDHVASVVHGVVDPTSGELEWAAAGHPPGLLIGPDSVTAAAPPRGPVLGAVPDIGYPVGRMALAPGSTLLLFTDGLVERRRESIDVSIERLATALSERSFSSASAVCEAALDAAAEEAVDDVCLLAVRRS